MSDAITEISEFLDTGTRLDLKTIALEHLVGLSGSSSGIDILLKNESMLDKLIKLFIEDKNASVKKQVLLAFVNVSAEQRGTDKFVDINNLIDFISVALKDLLDCENKDADAACMVLCNLTRHESILQSCVDVFMLEIENILDAFSNTDYNKKGAKLNYLGPLMSNLSVHNDVRKWICKKTTTYPILKVLPFCNYTKSAIRRGGAVGTIRNICFDVDCHDWLLSEEIDILSYLLQSLVGSEEYPDDEMDMFPPTIQFMPPEKERDVDPDIRKMILETLSRLCIKRKGRETLRSSGVYYVLRELHKWEQDKQALLACVNLVDILIRKEEEIEIDDITSVEVPDEYHEKFVKMDKDFVSEE